MMQSLIKMLSLIDLLEIPMSSITIRNLDEGIKARLRVRAALHGRSMEEETRAILRSALATENPVSTRLGDSIQRRFVPLGGVELRQVRREPPREPPDFA
jgi:plasmid stability protein